MAPGQIHVHIAQSSRDKAIPDARKRCVVVKRVAFTIVLVTEPRIMKVRYPTDHPHNLASAFFDMAAKVMNPSTAQLGSCARKSCLYKPNWKPPSLEFPRNLNDTLVKRRAERGEERRAHIWAVEHVELRAG